MRAKWAESTSRTIKVPSVQTILLAVLLVGAMVAIVSVSLAVRGETLTPTPPAPPVAQPAPEGPAAWLSARSTFWGAVAGGIGAIGTAGALLLGAVTFWRQLRDQHRAQAAAVSIYKFPIREGRRNRKMRVQLRNDSSLPIYGVSLVGTNRIGEYKDQSFRPALPAGEHIWVDITTAYGTSGFATFTDSFGNSWKRYMNGDFEPHGKKPERWSKPGSKQAVMAAARANRQSKNGQA